MRFVLLVATLCLTASSAARALPSNEVTTEFYSDPSRSTLVGERILTCGGGHAMWGRKTAFSEKSSSPCGHERRAGASIAVSSMLHQDPVAACHFRCQHIPLQSCPPPSINEPECLQPRAQCNAACDLLLDPSEPN